MCSYNLTFDPLKIKQSRASEGNDHRHQAQFLPIKNLDSGHKRFTRQRISDYSLMYPVHLPSKTGGYLLVGEVERVASNPGSPFRILAICDWIHGKELHPRFPAKPHPSRDISGVCKLRLWRRCHRITWEILPGSLSDFSPKLWDKIWNGEPGFEAIERVTSSGSWL